MNRDDVGFILGASIVVFGVIIGFSTKVPLLIIIPTTFIGILVQQLIHWKRKKKGLRAW